jgi:hypothetical protein
MLDLRHKAAALDAKVVLQVQQYITQVEAEAEAPQQVALDPQQVGAVQAALLQVLEVLQELLI